MDHVLDTSELRKEGRWLDIWKLQVPPKVKNFIWRACRGCLPTRVNVYRCGVNIPVDCPWCEQTSENTCHALLCCQKSEGCWRMLHIWHHIEPFLAIEENFGAIFFKVLPLLDEQGRIAFVMTLWSLWSSRDNKVWNAIDTRNQEIIQGGKMLLDEWCAARLRHSQPQHGESAVRRDSWVKPLPGFVKCNVDAAFSADHNRVGIGMCVRDEFGGFIGAKTLCHQPMLDVKIGEAYGLLMAIEWMRELGFKDVVFEMDAKTVVDGLHSSSPDITELGTILVDCKEKPMSHCENSHVEFVKRNANMVTHSLTKVAICTANPHVFNDVPACVSALMLNEMN